MGTITTFVVAAALAVLNGFAHISAKSALAIEHGILKVFPNSSRMILIHMAQLYDRSGDPAAALRCLADGRAKTLDTSPFDFESARIAERNGDYVEAARHYERLLSSSDVLSPAFCGDVKSRLDEIRERTLK